MYERRIFIYIYLPVLFKEKRELYMTYFVDFLNNFTLILNGEDKIKFFKGCLLWRGALPIFA